MKLHHFAKRRFTAWSGSVALGVALFAAVPSYASDDIGQIENVERDSSDLQAYAELHSLDPESAADRAATEELLHSISAEPRELADDSLAGMYIEHVPELTLVVRVINEAPSALSDAVERSDLPVSIEIGDTPSLAYTEGIIADIDWRHFDEDIQGAYVDESTNDIVVQLLGDAGKAQVAEANLQNLIGQDVRIIVEPVEAESADTNRGGRDLTVALQDSL